ncbi:NAD-binding protein [Mucilaginibacter polytrichastri]|uniref:RCK N-terminal domain-containing protein n=1 Tax=Mucilaginibacter polytrichastri TaxID=1302689 RepID=A0A1Q5ZYJ3_9SPHI|nr:NAD-binding protein [Mucilaginibacter polytrichastri]OKS86817.1 hypothetical protein RG47T_2274 [Mucilaginibacter polytrichastri]SFT22833.1 TrkA-N domain-containing protein [Mucilaginibacter polytrichastri]
MSADHSVKPVKIHPLLVVLAVLAVFVLAITGYYQELGHEFNFWGAAYSALGLFFFHHVSAKVDNVLVLIAAYLAAAVFIVSIFSLIFSKIYKAYLVVKIRLTYRDHIVVFSLSQIGRKIALELLKNGYKVIVIEKKDDHFSSEIKKKGGVVLAEKDINTEFENSFISHASVCVLAEADDAHNIKLVNSLIAYLHGKPSGRVTKMLVHIHKTDNINVLKDYLDINNKHEHYDLETFNVYQLAARKIYDQFPPHAYVTDNEKEEEQAIAIVGFNQVAENFLLENIILSHSPAMTNLTIYLLDKNADTAVSHFAYKYPFYNEYIDLVPVKLLNTSFYANFAWSKKEIEKISKVKIAYMFGDSDAALLTASTNLRQFFYAQTLSISQIPVVICLPEDAEIINLLDADHDYKGGIKSVFSQQLNIHQVKLISDTCTSDTIIEESALTDKLSRIINYYYALKYEFAGELKQKYNLNNAADVIAALEHDIVSMPETLDSINEKVIEDYVLKYLTAKTSANYSELKARFSIQKRWNVLSHRKKDSNRYAARQIAFKVSSLKRMGCWPLNRQNIQLFFPKLAPMEHKRWSAEKIVFNFKYGPLPDNKDERFILKDILKIHDQIIPFDKLDDLNQEKDLNFFLLLPLLNSIKNN